MENKPKSPGTSKEVKPKVNPQVTSQGNVNPSQKLEIGNYVPRYKIKVEFKQAVIKAIGDRPFNEIAGLINAIEVDTIDHQTLEQVIKALGQFPYVRVEGIIKNINNFITQVIED